MVVRRSPTSTGGFTRDIFFVDLSVACIIYQQYQLLYRVLVLSQLDEDSDMGGQILHNMCRFILATFNFIILVS